ncbi:MAG: nucleotidyltransferase domain-containing protein [Steroidobacteraceae bacterium]
MPASSRLGEQLTQVTTALREIGVRYALIGGLALAPHHVIRATQDVDLLVDALKAEEVDAKLAQLGYRCIHRSADAGNYLRADERIDLIYAHRPIAKRLLIGAAELSTSLGHVRVISIEGLIGFKLQGLVNDPRRTQDREDIRALLKANRGQLDLTEVREYFELFDRVPLLDELLRETS